VPSFSSPWSSLQLIACFFQFGDRRLGRGLRVKQGEKKGGSKRMSFNAGMTMSMD
jgi:hypothetical protein